MSLALELDHDHLDKLPDTRQGRWSGAWSLLAGGLAVLLGALYPLSVALIGPAGLPILVIGVVLLAISLRWPGVGVAVAFVLTSSPVDLVNAPGWLPAAVWTAMLLALLLLRPASGAGGGLDHGSSLPPLAVPLLVYGGTVLVAYAASPAHDLGLPILRSTVTGILLFLVAALALRSWSDLTTALLGTSGAAVLAGGLATLQHLLGVSSGVGFVTSTGELVGRVTGGFGHPNLLAGFLVVLVPLTFAAAVVDRRWRLLHLAGLVLSLGGIYASFSRGALLAVALVPLFLLRGRWLLLLAPIGILALGFAVPSVLTERFALGGGNGAELASRSDIWRTAGAVWVERPLFGTGLGGFSGEYAAVRVVGKQFLPNTNFKPPPHAHNLPLQILAEQGLVGFAALGAVAAASVSAALRLRRAADRRIAVLGSAVLASVVGLFVHNLFDVTLLENAGVQLWGVLGILSALVTLRHSSTDGA